MNIDRAKLESVLGARLPGFEALLSCERLTAGASRETYRLNARIAGVEKQLALRRSATGEESSLKQGPGLTAEASLFRAARAAGVPGPQVCLVLEAADNLGAGFVMDWIDGETLGARIARSDAFAAIRPKLARQCGEILGRLHSIDIAASGLDKLLDVMTPEDCVRQTYASYLAFNTAQPMIDFAAHWLLANLPSDRPPALVHSDFRNGNFIVRPDDGVVAVLDWELAHIGDPMRDLGWICTRSWRFGVRGKPVGGFGGYDDLFAGYESVTGQPVDREAVRFWEVFGSFWWAVGTLAMAQSWRDGSETSVERPAIGRRSSECQIDCVNLLIPGPATPPAEARHDLSTSTLPRTAELLTAVRDFLARDLVASVEGRNAFLARVAANSVDTVLRELSLGADAVARERLMLSQLLGEPGEAAALRQRLCEQIRQGLMPLDAPGLHDYLRTSVLAQVLIDQPRYPGAIEALGRV
ncbi:MAG: phosphotransferase [Alphaproteobacteria bacterium]|nr:phosphotransferase [Alphaproteobacteria bacterium]